jgi:hypothetical protein
MHIMLLSRTNYVDITETPDALCLHQAIFACFSSWQKTFGIESPQQTRAFIEGANTRLKSKSYVVEFKVYRNITLNIRAYRNITLSDVNGIIGLVKSTPPLTYAETALVYFNAHRTVSRPARLLIVQWTAVQLGPR